MPPTVQPFIKLVQSNMALITQFSSSPEVVSQAMSNAQSLFQQGQGFPTQIARSNAFGQLMQGMLQNYAVFMTELGQGGMEMLAQGQTAMMDKAQEAAESVADSGTRGRRAR
jgi:hypothetical protein